MNLDRGNSERGNLVERTFYCGTAYEDLVKTLRTLVDERDRQLAELGEKMSDAEASARQLLDAKVTDLERLRASHVAELERLSTGQKEEVLCLHARYEGVILGMEDKFADDTEKLNRRHLHELEASAVSSRQEMQSLQAEFHQAVQVQPLSFSISFSTTGGFSDH